jgi:hypothetical protein
MERDHAIGGDSDRAAGHGAKVQELRRRVQRRVVRPIYALPALMLRCIEAAVRRASREVVFRGAAK